MNYQLCILDGINMSKEIWKIRYVIFGMDIHDHLVSAIRVMIKLPA